MRAEGLTLLLGAGAGALVAMGVREALLGSPALAAWVRNAFEPLARARREGYAPSALERRRLAALGAVGALGLGMLVAGPGLGIPLAVAGPATAAWAVSRGRSRYRRGVERALPEIALAVADSLSAGRSLRGSLAAAAASLDGPAAAELSRLGAELELGSPTSEALAGLRARLRSARVDAFAGAVLSQQLAGGDLAGLLRRFADGAAEQDRAAEDARSATAQARFTGLLVVAMPTGAALFAELVQPGFFGRMLASSTAAALLALAAALQVAGFAAIQRLARVGP
ncbi:MAG: type II secretion system F family protein [Solirubrobacterales bacterium]